MNTEIKERRIIIIDFEVLSKANFWLCSMKDVKTEAEHTIVNNPDELKRIYNKNKDSIWVGYNIKGYDQWIFKSIIADENPCKVSEAIIDKKLNPWDIHPKLNKIHLNFFELSLRDKSLKELELFMGESIEESSIPFDLPRFPKKEEVEELARYCKHDVRMTYKVFQVLRKSFDSRAFLIDYFGFKDVYFKKTDAQFAAATLDAKKPLEPRNDEFDFRIIDCICLDKYQYILHWYKNPMNKDYSKSLTANVYGSIVEFGWGGLHSAKKQYKGEGLFVNSDVSSYHPSNMIENNFLSRNIADASKYVNIKKTRLKFKASKNPWEKPFKDVLNITYGSMKDPSNELYDPQMANAVCVNGQLMLLDLIEKVENRFGSNAEFIQGNTDGVMFKFNCKEDIDEYIKICEDWSKRTKMELEHDFINKVIQKDVNNYAIVMNNGKVKSKGSYIKPLSYLDNDLPIVNKALLNYLIDGVSIRETIESSNNLIDFQKSIKISSKYDGAIHNGKVLNLKVLRVFASNNPKDGPVMKIKNGTQIKIGNTPNRAFILNENIVDKPVLDTVDREWYISLAEKRLEDFIPNSQYEYSLFDLL